MSLHFFGSSVQECLERELAGHAYGELLNRLKQGNPFFHRFRTWTEVLAFMRHGTSQDPEKDEILRPIFLAHQEDADPCWRAILLAIFFPALESIDRQKRSWDQDREELWQNIVSTFLGVVCRIDIHKRPDRLVQKVFNDTVHRLHDEYRRIWRRSKCEVSVELHELDELAGQIEGIDLAAIERREAQEAEVQRLRRHLEKGRISEKDFMLLTGTRVYGKSLADYAREMGMDYQVAKKRRQRAEDAIRDHENGR